MCVRFRKRIVVVVIMVKVRSDVYTVSSKDLLASVLVWISLVWLVSAVLLCLLVK
jgi:hypothetical protein